MMLAPTYALKIIPLVDGSAHISVLVRYFPVDVTVKGAWTAPAAVELAHHALAPVAPVPVLTVLSGMHVLTDMTLASAAWSTTTSPAHQPIAKETRHEA